MINIYSFLKNVLLEVKTESKNNLSFLAIVLLLATIPLKQGFNNVALGLLVLASILHLKKAKISLSVTILLPILLFVLMAISFFWSINPSETITALPKESILFIAPLCFIILPKFTSFQKEKLIKYYSYSIVVLVFYYLIKAIIRYILTNDSRVFFYHGENNDDYGLVPKLLNAIHVSVFVSVAFFYFLTQIKKSIYNAIALLLLFVFIILLSSKNIIVVFLFLLLLYFIFFGKKINKAILLIVILFGIIIIGLTYGKIKERFATELKDNTTIKSTTTSQTVSEGIHNVTVYEAWTNKSFNGNDYFAGTAFRVYQIRMFLKIINQDDVWVHGLGLNASYRKLKELGDEMNVYKGDQNHQGYSSKNFHNQYLQNFAELGIFGLLILLMMLFINLKNAVKNRNFVHFCFAILMISLFLTESFLWRQRGVVFFTLFYCLFNLPTHQKYIKE